VVAVASRDALQRADAVVLAVPFRVLKGVTDEIAESLSGKFLVVPSCPVGLDARGKVARLPPKRQSFRKWYRRGLDRRWRSGQCRPIRFESFGDPSPERAVLVEVIDDGRAGEDVERSIRPAGFERMKVTGSKGRVESSRGRRLPSRCRRRPRGSGSRSSWPTSLSRMAYVPFQLRPGIRPGVSRVRQIP
jgi:NADP oxidoreductase coenzyme F420-dependent